MKTIITTGAVFADIDALACAVAYKELLTMKGVEGVEILIPGPLNNTVTKSVLEWKFDISKFDDSTGSNYIIVDCSNKEVLPKSAKTNYITEVWDHRYGYQEQWDINKTRLVIDEIGACATLIWEEFKTLGFNNKISKISANLLYTAIFSNTLNFNAGVTTDRDRIAFNELKGFVDLPESWIDLYYQESESQILIDPVLAIKSDTKVVDFPNENIKITIGQMELWNSFKFINEYKESIKNVLEGFGSEEWFMTAPSISEGKNYIFCENQKTKDILTSILDIKFNGDLGVTSKLWLRKEILKKILIK